MLFVAPGIDEPVRQSVKFTEQGRYAGGTCYGKGDGQIELSFAVKDTVLYPAISSMYSNLFHRWILPLPVNMGPVLGWPSVKSCGVDGGRLPCAASGGRDYFYFHYLRAG